MGVLSEKFRKLAEDLTNISLEERVKLGPEDQVLSLVIVAQCKAALYDALADVMESGVPLGRLATTQRMQQFMEKNNSLRAAAAKGYATGDYSDLNTIVRAAAAGGTNGSAASGA